MVKDRSMAMRKGACSRASPRDADATRAASASASFSSSSPSPDMALVRTIGASARKRVTDQFAYFFFDEFHPVRFGNIAFRQSNDASWKIEQAKYLEVLTCLLFYGIIGSHNQKCEIDAGGPRQHLPHKSFVARNIDNAEPEFVKIELSESQLDRDSTLLLFRQPVGIGACQRFDERGLAVVDVTRGSQNQMRRHKRFTVHVRALRRNGRSVAVVGTVAKGYPAAALSQNQSLPPDAAQRQVTTMLALCDEKQPKVAELILKLRSRQPHEFVNGRRSRRFFLGEHVVQERALLFFLRCG